MGTCTWGNRRAEWASSYSRTNESQGLGCHQQSITDSFSSARVLSLDFAFSFHYLFLISFRCPILFVCMRLWMSMFFFSLHICMLCILYICLLFLFHPSSEYPHHVHHKDLHTGTKWNLQKFEGCLACILFSGIESWWLVRTRKFWLIVLKQAHPIRMLSSKESWSTAFKWTIRFIFPCRNESAKKSKSGPDSKHKKGHKRGFKHLLKKFTFEVSLQYNRMR